MNTIWLKFAGIAVLIAIACYGTWYATSDHYEVKIEAMQRDWQAAYAQSTQMQLDQAQQTIQLRQKAETQHGKDQLAINDLAHQLDGVRIHFACGGETSAASTASPGTDGGGGVLSARMDAAFERLQSGVDRLIQRCDQLNIDAKRLNAEIGQ